MVQPSPVGFLTSAFVDTVSHRTTLSLCTWTQMKCRQYVESPCLRKNGKGQEDQEKKNDMFFLSKYEQKSGRRVVYLRILGVRQRAAEKNEIQGHRKVLTLKE